MFESRAGGTVEQDVFWTVVYVHDHESPSESFAYTVGLADEGLPELYMRARPEQAAGESPWTFSDRDCCSQLNSFAQRLVSGTLPVGSSFELTYDAGLTSLVWSVGAPVAPLAVDAYRASPSCTVVPMAAALVPAPQTRLADLPPDLQAFWRREVADVVSATPPNRRGLRGFPPPLDDAPFTCDREYGPMTPLVQAYAYAFSQATPQRLADFVHRILDADRCFGPRSVLAVAHTLAKRSGRAAAAAAAHDLGATIVRSLRGPNGESSTWRSMLKATGCTREDDSDDLGTGLSRLLAGAASALFVTSAVADRAQHTTRLAAFGPWSSTSRTTSLSPHESWWAPDVLLDLLRATLDDLDWERLDLLLHTWDSNRNDPLVMLLRGLAVTGCRATPPASELLAGSLAGVRAALTPEVEWQLTEFLCCTTALLSERAEFDAAAVRSFCEPLERVLPELESMLNSPVVAPRSRP